MINNSLIQPENIMIIGGSDNPSKPGGGLLVNLLNSAFNRDVYVVNKRNFWVPKKKPDPNT